MKIITLTPNASPRQGVIAKTKGTTLKGYLFEPGDIITDGLYVIDQKSYRRDYEEKSNDGETVTFIKTAKMFAAEQEELIDHIDEFNANVSKRWIEESVRAKGIAHDGRTAFVNTDGDLTLVESEKVAVVPKDSLVLFNVDEGGEYFNCYYCPKATVRKKYTGYEG